MINNKVLFVCCSQVCTAFQPSNKCPSAGAPERVCGVCPYCLLCLRRPAVFVEEERALPLGLPRSQRTHTGCIVRRQYPPPRPMWQFFSSVQDEATSERRYQELERGRGAGGGATYYTMGSRCRSLRSATLLARKGVTGSLVRGDDVGLFRPDSRGRLSNIRITPSTPLSTPSVPPLQQHWHLKGFCAFGNVSPVTIVWVTFFRTSFCRDLYDNDAMIVPSGALTKWPFYAVCTLHGFLPGWRLRLLSYARVFVGGVD